MLKLLGRASSSNVQKVLWCLVELGLPFDRVDIGGRFGGNREPDYLSLNPHGVVPTLVDGEVVVWESNTILRYLCNREPPVTLYDQDAPGRAVIDGWLDWQQTMLAPAITPVFWGLVRTAPAERDPDLIERQRLLTAQRLAILDARLSTRDYVAGDHLTVADLAIGPLVYRWYQMAIERPPLAAIEAWYGRLQPREGFKRWVMVGLE